jgi:hypothetical protein
MFHMRKHPVIFLYAYVLRRSYICICAHIRFLPLGDSVTIAETMVIYVFVLVCMCMNVCDRAWIS